jgi:hypothetical protein
MDLDLRNRIARQIEEDDRIRAERAREDYARQQRAAPPPVEPPLVVMPSPDVMAAAVKQALDWDRPEHDEELAAAAWSIRKKLIALRAKVDVLLTFAQQRQRGRP